MPYRVKRNGHSQRSRKPRNNRTLHRRRKRTLHSRQSERPKGTGNGNP